MQSSSHLCIRCLAWFEVSSDLKEDDAVECPACGFTVTYGDLLFFETHVLEPCPSCQGTGHVILERKPLACAS